MEGFLTEKEIKSRLTELSKKNLIDGLLKKKIIGKVVRKIILVLSLPPSPPKQSVSERKKESAQKANLLLSMNDYD